MTTNATPSALGLTVPDFTAATTGGDFQLATHRGTAVVLYFYPKDNTPGCTTEAMQFRDLHPEFLQAGAKILGVSRDSLKSHTGFKEKLGLPFDLISDGDEAVCRLFDVIKTKNMYGKQVKGIERSTFLISPEGCLTQEWRGIRAEGHAAEVLNALRKFG